ncbi:unnamed protein product [Amoebophrya sp. A25]|nr:unnamed protein product [Amoebophrya sp. A25]|eukprot:GSA25T00026251001.1
MTLYSLENFAQVLEEELEKLPFVDNSRIPRAAGANANSAAGSPTSPRAGSPQLPGSASMHDLAREERALQDYMASTSVSGPSAGTPGLQGMQRPTVRAQHGSKNTRYPEGFNPYCPHKAGSGRACSHSPMPHSRSSASPGNPGRRTRVPVKPIIVPPMKATHADVVLMRGYVSRMMKKLREGLRLQERDSLMREQKRELDTLIVRFEEKEKAKEGEWLEQRAHLESQIDDMAGAIDLSQRLLSKHQTWMQTKLGALLGVSQGENLVRSAFAGWKDVTMSVKHELFALQIAKTVHEANKHRFRAACLFFGRNHKNVFLHAWRRYVDGEKKARALLWCVNQAKVKMQGAYNKEDRQTLLVIFKLWKADTDKELIISANEQEKLNNRLLADKEKLERVQKSMSNLAMRNQAKGAEADAGLLSWMFQCWEKELRKRKDAEKVAWERWNLRIKMKRQHIKTFIVKAWGEGLEALRRETRMEEWNNRLVKRFQKDIHREQRRDLFDAWNEGIRVQREEEREALRQRQEALSKRQQELAAQGLAMGEKAKENALQKWEGRAVKQRFFIAWRVQWEKLGLRNRAIQQIAARSQAKMRLMVTFTAWRTYTREIQEKNAIQATHLEYKQQTAARLFSFIGGTAAKTTGEKDQKVKAMTMKKWKERVVKNLKIRRRVAFFADRCKEDFFLVWRGFVLRSNIEYYTRGELVAERVAADRIRSKAAQCFKLWKMSYVQKNRMRRRFTEHKEWFHDRWKQTVSLRHAFSMWRFTKCWNGQLRAAKDAANLSQNGVKHLRTRRGFQTKLKVFKEWSAEIVLERARRELNNFHGERMQMMMNKVVADMAFLSGPNRCFAEWKKLTKEGKTQAEMVDHLYNLWRGQREKKRLQQAVRAWREYSMSENMDKMRGEGMGHLEKMNAEHQIFRISFRWEKLVQTLLDRNGDALLKMITQQTGEMKLKMAETKYDMAQAKIEVLQGNLAKIVACAQDLGSWYCTRDSKAAHFQAWRSKVIEETGRRNQENFQKKLDNYMKAQSKSQSNVMTLVNYHSRAGCLQKCWRIWLECVKDGYHEKEITDKNMQLLQEKQGRIRKMFFAMGAQDSKLLKGDLFKCWQDWIKKERKVRAIERYVSNHLERNRIRKHLDLWAASVFDIKGNRFMENRKHDYKFSLSCLVRKNSGIQNRYLLLIVWRAWMFYHSRMQDIRSGNVDRIVKEARDLRDRNWIARYLHHQGLDASQIRSQYFTELHRLRDGTDVHVSHSGVEFKRSSPVDRDFFVERRRNRIREQDEPGRYYAEMWNEETAMSPSRSGRRGDSVSVVKAGGNSATRVTSVGREMPYRIHVVPPPGEAAHYRNVLSTERANALFVQNSAPSSSSSSGGRYNQQHAAPSDDEHRSSRGRSNSRSREVRFEDQDRAHQAIMAGHSPSRVRSRSREVPDLNGDDDFYIDQFGYHHAGRSLSARRSLPINRWYEDYDRRRSIKLDVEKRLALAAVDSRYDHGGRFDYLLDLHELEGLQYLFDSHPSSCGGWDVTLALLKRLLMSMSVVRVFKGELKAARYKARNDNMLLVLGFHAFRKTLSYQAAAQTEVSGEVRGVEEVRDSVVQTGPMDKDVEIVFMPQPPSSRYIGGSAIAEQQYNRDKAYLKEIRTYLGYVADELSHRLRIAASVSGSAPQTSLTTATNILTWLSHLVEKFRHPDTLGEAFGSSRYSLYPSGDSVQLRNTDSVLRSSANSEQQLRDIVYSNQPAGIGQNHSYSASGPQYQSARGTNSASSPHTIVGPVGSIGLGLPPNASAANVVNAMTSPRGGPMINVRPGDRLRPASPRAINPEGMIMTSLAYKPFKSTSKEWQRDVDHLIRKANSKDTNEHVGVISSSTAALLNSIPGPGGSTSSKNTKCWTTSSYDAVASTLPKYSSTLRQGRGTSNGGSVAASGSGAAGPYNYLNYKTQNQLDTEAEQYRNDITAALAQQRATTKNPRELLGLTVTSEANTASTMLQRAAAGGGPGGGSSSSGAGRDRDNSTGDSGGFLRSSNWTSKAISTPEDDRLTSEFDASSRNLLKVSSAAGPGSSSSSSSSFAPGPRTSLVADYGFDSKNAGSKNVTFALTDIGGPSGKNSTTSASPSAPSLSPQRVLSPPTVGPRQRSRSPSTGLEPLNTRAAVATRGSSFSPLGGRADSMNIGQSLRPGRMLGLGGGLGSAGGSSSAKNSPSSGSRGLTTTSSSSTSNATTSHIPTIMINNMPVLEPGVKTSSRSPNSSAVPSPRASD